MYYLESLADELESFLLVLDLLIRLSLTILAILYLSLPSLFPENKTLIGGDLSVIPPFCRNQRA